MPGPSAASRDLFVVHVASDRSRAEALAVFAELQHRYASLLKGAEADVHEVDLGAEGVWHRLRIGPAGTRAEAKAVCKRLQSAGLTSCVVMPR